MFTLYGQRHGFCDGLSRREFVRAGALGAWSLASLLRCEAQAAAPRKRPNIAPRMRLSGLEPFVHG